MRIVNWNVLIGNQKMGELYGYALKQNPDVLCFQEINEKELKELKTWDDFNLVHTEDFNYRGGRGNLYTCLLTKYEIKNTESFLYSKKKNNSLINNIVYELITGKTEIHRALFVDLEVKGINYRIFTARLSTAVGSRDRIQQLKNIIFKFKKNSINIIAGDLNIPSKYWFSIAVGWVQGFKLKDYVIFDYKMMKKLLGKNGLVNPHEGTSTLGFKFSPNIQLDYILVPKGVKIKESFVSPHGFGSDHRMVFVDISQK